MKYSVLSIILLLSVNFSAAQTLTLRVSGLIEKKAALSFLSGEKISLIDSLSINTNSEFVYNFEKHVPGIYHLAFDNKSRLDFVYDREDIVIRTDAASFPDSMEIISSESNRIYHEFIKLNRAYKTKSELLQLILARYPVEDDYYNTTRDKLMQVQEDYLYFVNLRARENPGSFVARYIRTSQLPAAGIGIPAEKQLTYLKTHALDNVNFYDEGLIYSDAFTNKTIEYLTYFRNPQLPLKLLEQEFMKAIDSVLSRANVNEAVYKHIVEYLLDGFRKFGFDNVISYIVGNYVIKDDICLDEGLASALERRIEQARKFTAGNSVPNIIMQDKTGRKIDLHKLSADKLLLLFYSTSCPHCTELLPEIHKIYKEQKVKKLEVVAISLDQEGSSWQEYIKSNSFEWINLSDTEGWSSKAAREYHIYATPAMFLLDGNKKLIAIPANKETVRSMIE
jgi:peroxiredoxin